MSTAENSAHFGQRGAWAAGPVGWARARVLGANHRHQRDRFQGLFGTLGWACLCQRASLGRVATKSQKPTGLDFRGAALRKHASEANAEHACPARSALPPPLLLPRWPWVSSCCRLPAYQAASSLTHRAAAPPNTQAFLFFFFLAVSALDGALATANDAPVAPLGPPAHTSPLAGALAQPQLQHPTHQRRRRCAELVHRRGAPSHPSHSHYPNFPCSHHHGPATPRLRRRRSMRAASRGAARCWCGAAKQHASLQQQLLWPLATALCG